MAAARRTLVRDKGRHWATASGSVRARYLRAIAAKVSDIFDLFIFLMHIICLCFKYMLHFGFADNGKEV